MEKIIIIGGEGNLGQQLVKVFSKDYEVIAWDRGEIDITDKELVMKKITDLKPAFIINAAAYNAVDKMENDDAEYDIAKRVNIDGPRNLAEAALAIGAVIVHYSSDYVFNGKKIKGYLENDKTEPINRYGKTKSIGEKAVIELSGKGLKWYLIRTSKLFGPKGESKFSKEDFFSLMLNAVQTKKDLQLIKNEEISCFTYTPDLAQATKNLLSGEYGFGIYHLVNENPASWHEGAEYLFKLKNISDVRLNAIAAKDYLRPAKRPKYSALLNTKFSKLRGWKEALTEYSGV
jgi:dTDP-4-dehydrorhamnose reductase